MVKFHMNTAVKSKTLILLLLMVGMAGCKSGTASKDYNPKELTLLIASNNHGEVGPCG
jgi:predicted component of type VI protein secretion system